MTRTGNAGSQQRTAVSSLLGSLAPRKTRFATARVSGRKETKSHDWCLKKQKNKCGWARPAQTFEHMASAMLVNPMLVAFIVCGPVQFLVSKFEPTFSHVILVSGYLVLTSAN